jgi:FG-GAP-like repeat
MLRIFVEAILAVMLFCSVVQAQTQNLFFQPPTYPGNGQLFTGDLNQDGKADLIFADGTVLLGNGDGTFKTVGPWNTNAPTGANLSALADFNGDGKLDLLLRDDITCCLLSVMLGNGDGTFQPPITTSNLGTSFNPVFALDINGDGKADLIGLGAGGLWVFLGKRDGTFAAPGTLYPTSSQGLTLGDFNEDGKPDILLASSPVDGTTPGSIQVLLGNGDGSFQTAITSTGVPQQGALVVGDVNGDGKLDLLVNSATSPSGSSGHIYTLLGNGDGSFEAPVSSGSLTADDIPMLLGDLNGDGKLDLIFSDNPFTVVALGNGDGTFTAKHTYFAGGQMATADFNGDSKSDIAVGNQILIGNGDGSFKDNPASLVGFTTLLSALTADFNGDGYPDIAAVSDISTKAVYIMLNDGTGQFSVAHTYTFPEQPFFISTGDLNGDGKPDLVTITADPITSLWSLNTLFGNGDGSFSPPIVYPTTVSGYPPSPIAIADFNGDHRADVALLDLSSNLIVLLSNGDGTFGAALSAFAGARPSSLVVGDFNNDGNEDVADASDAGLGILLGKGDGTFQSAVFPNSATTQVLTAADLNGDGNLDLITGSSGGIQVFLGNGDGTFTALPFSVLNGPPLAVGDVNQRFT